MKKQAFDGIKVADFSWGAAGPQVGRELAEHGATVVHVESHKQICGLRLIPPFRDGKPGIDRAFMGAAYNTNKYGISLDMSLPEGLEVAKKLVQWADVVSDSRAPGVMEELMLDYENCRKINPGIIYYSTTQQGQWGPHHKFRGYGYHTNALMGISATTGWPDSEATVVSTPWTDFISSWHLLLAVIGALSMRHKTGVGTHIEQSQLESGLSVMAPHLLNFMVNDKVSERTGNRDPHMAPHGIYPCEGSDRWIAIAVSDEDQWQKLCKITDNSLWVEDPRFKTFRLRKENEDTLDRLMGEWTKNHSAENVMEKLQKKGIPAGIVQTGEDLLNDPQLKYRKHFRYLEHKGIGKHPYHSPAYRLSKTPCDIKTAGPCLGEHNDYVYKEILGFSDDEISKMLIRGVITNEHDSVDQDV